MKLRIPVSSRLRRKKKHEKRLSVSHSGTGSEAPDSKKSKKTKAERRRIRRRFERSG